MVCRLLLSLFLLAGIAAPSLAAEEPAQAPAPAAVPGPTPQVLEKLVELRDG